MYDDTTDWTHACCTDCWNRREPERPAVRSVVGAPEICCFCSQATQSGIYVRGDPRVVHGHRVAADDSAGENAPLRE